MVEPMLNILHKNSFCNFVKYRKSFFPSFIKNNYWINTFFPCEEEDINTMDWTSNK